MTTRGDTYQPNGYLPQNPNQSHPQTIQMQDYNTRKNNQTQPQDKQTYQQREPAKNEEEPSMKGYLLHWALFLLALGVFVGVWAVDYFAVGRQYSYYYYNSVTVSSAVDTATYTSSQTMFGTADFTDTLSIAMSLVYSWLLWKGPLCGFVLHLTAEQTNKGIRIGTFVGLVVLCLAGDVLLTIFAKSFHGEWIYYGLFTLLAVVVVLINNAGIGRAKQSLANVLIPLLTIAFLYCCYSLFLPKLYGVYYDTYSTSSILTVYFLVFYLYPCFDLLLYSFTLILGNKVEWPVKGLVSAIHFMLIGYGAGMVLLVGYTEVEFYYLLAYFIFRNVFVNHVMRRWQKVVANPPALPGWGIAYYVGYGLSYMPVCGVAGKLVVAKSFISYIYARTATSLYGTANPLYPSTTAPTSTLGTNFTFSGSIYWLAGVLIWIAFTFSQRYNKHMPSFYDLFYYLVGLQLFYIGLACALSTMNLTLFAHI